jgi:hypothetical protein
MDKQMNNFPRLKHEKHPVSDRLQRSVDPSLFASNRENLREMIALSLSTPADFVSPSLNAVNVLRASSPATFVFAAQPHHEEKQHLVVPLETQDPQVWQEVFSNKIVGGKVKNFFFSLCSEVWIYYFFRKKGSSFSGNDCSCSTGCVWFD